MKLDFNEFLRVQTCIMIALLVIQALDYVFGFGVNPYLFVVFCIVFSFTLGSVYYNILITKHNKNYDEKFRDMEYEMSCNCEEIHAIISNLEERIDVLSEED